MEPAGETGVLVAQVEFSIENRVVHVLHDVENRLDVVLHVRNLDVADRPALALRRILGLVRKLRECVYMLGDVIMIGIDDIVAIGDIRDDSVTTQQAAGELVCSVLHRRTVNRIADVLILLPLIAFCVQMVHDRHAELLAATGELILAGHVADGVGKPAVAEGDGRISSLEMREHLFAWLQSQIHPMLPEGRGDI